MNQSAMQHALKGDDGPTLFFSGPGGLLPWQGALLAGVCGIFALFYPLPAVTAFALLWLGWCLFGGRVKTGFGMLAVFGFGLALAWMHLPAHPELPVFVGNGKKVELRGIVNEVNPRPDQRLTVLLDNAQAVLEDGSTVNLPGLVSWSWHAPTERVAPGQSVRLSVRVDPMRSFGNPGAWDYALAQRIQDIHTRIYSRGQRNGLVFGKPPHAPVYQWRVELTRVIERAAPGQGGAMLAALLTGDRFGLEPETLDLVRSAGLSHTLALSGLHLSFVVMMGLGVSWGVSLAWPQLLLSMPRPKLGVLTACPMVVGYLWLGGFAPSLLRASLMFAFMAFFLLRGRGRVVVDGLFFALAVILVLDPLAALDIRLQLSATAVAGIGVFMPMLLGALRNWPGMQFRPVRWAVGILAVSLCATLCILPITARTFGMVAPNLLLNLVWLPLLGLIVMPLGLAGLIVSLVSMQAGALLFALAGGVLGQMLAGLGLAGEADILPMIQLLRPLWPQLLGAFLLFGALAASLRVDLKRERQLWGAVLLGVALMVWPHLQVMNEDASGVRLEVVDVGQGQALILTAPGGRRTVVDGGGLRSRTFDAGRDVVAPYLTLGRPPRIDNVILTHPHADHYKGLIHLLRSFEVAAFYHGGKMPGGKYRKPFSDALGELEPVRSWAGDVLELAPLLQLETVHPGERYEPTTTNDTSLIQRLTYDGQGLALICGDAENPALEAMVAEKRALDAQVLVLPHHGSQTSYLPAFYDSVMPRLAICSSGYRNRAIHPFSAVKDALAKRNCSVMKTWQEGLIRVDWTGESGQRDTFYEVETGR